MDYNMRIMSLGEQLTCLLDTVSNVFDKHSQLEKKVEVDSAKHSSQVKDLHDQVAKANLKVFQLSKNAADGNTVPAPILARLVALESNAPAQEAKMVVIEDNCKSLIAKSATKRVADIEAQFAQAIRACEAKYDTRLDALERNASGPAICNQMNVLERDMDAKMLWHKVEIEDNCKSLIASSATERVAEIEAQFTHAIRACEAKYDTRLDALERNAPALDNRITAIERGLEAKIAQQDAVMQSVEVDCKSKLEDYARAHDIEAHVARAVKACEAKFETHVARVVKACEAKYETNLAALAAMHAQELARVKAGVDAKADAKADAKGDVPVVGHPVPSAPPMDAADADCFGWYSKHLMASTKRAFMKQLSKVVDLEHKMNYEERTHRNAGTSDVVGTDKRRKEYDMEKHKLSNLRMTAINTHKKYLPRLSDEEIENALHA